MGVTPRERYLQEQLTKTKTDLDRALAHNGLLEVIIADQARDESGRVSMPLSAHDKIDTARKERDEAVARAGKAEAERDELRSRLDRVPPNMGNAMNQIDVLVRQRDKALKQIATLRGLAELQRLRVARDAVKTEREIELEKRVAAMHAVLVKWLPVECETLGDGRTCPEYVPRADWCRACDVRTALADTNPGSDWVPRAELEDAEKELAQTNEWLYVQENTHQAELRRVAEAEKLAQAEVKRLEEIQAERARLFFEANAERAEVSLVLTGRIEAPQPGKLPTIARAVLDAHRVELRRVAEASWSAGHQSGCKCDHMVEPDGRGDCASERVRDLDAIVRGGRKCA